MVSICTNCALLVCLYDREGKWNISPGLAAILIMEHVLLLIKFGFSRIVPEVFYYFIWYIYIYFFKLVELYFYKNENVFGRNRIGWKQTEWRTRLTHKTCVLSNFWEIFLVVEGCWWKLIVIDLFDTRKRIYVYNYYTPILD